MGKGIMDFNNLEYGTWAKVAGYERRLMVIDWDSQNRSVRLLVSEDERRWFPAEEILDQPTDFMNGSN